MPRGVLLLAAFVLTVATGCASGSLAASPPTAQEPDCRGGGYYNRAAGFCVSGGPYRPDIV